MTHPTPEQLSLHLDDELDPGTAREIAAHLETCPACATLLGELRQVVARAAALEDRPPHADLWPGVAAAIGTAPARRRVTVSVPQLLAAGIVLMLLSGGTVFVALRLAPATPRPAMGVSPEPVSLRPASVTPDRGYDAAIRELQAELDARRNRLDTTTVRVVEDKLRLVNHAILEAERALAADPANAYLTGHLTETRMRKLDLLRRVTALTRAVS